ncbi:aureobasidin A1 biosynthesis complex [Aspergillus luchuensis]|uniref:Aureobasidin A1 biosynthesis complex n=1 Tax=Aspergillus kawachii TaxID=1069201 RepID=A0A146FLT6_ASPKA|nr:aureobasidin A1 biosynthesis complex [Aspergillus luchuensis]
MPPRQGSSRLFGVVSSVQVAVARAKSTRRVPQDKTKRQPGYPRFRCKVSADNWKPRQACQLRESGYPGSLARSSPLSTQISRLIRKVDNPSTRKISKIFFSCRVAPLVRDRGFHVALAGEVMRPGFDAWNGKGKIELAGGQNSIAVGLPGAAAIRRRKANVGPSHLIPPSFS